MRGAFITRRSAFAQLIALLCMLGLVIRPAAAQQLQVLRDAETEALLNDISAPLIRAAGLSPANVQIQLIHDPSINAFVAGGQAVWIHTGLIASADNVNQVQGVIAHELGHIEGGHVLRFTDGMKESTGISILSLVLAAGAMAAGAGEAGAALLGLGQQMAMSRFLGFSRNQESAADLAGARYLAAAGISGKGSIAFFKKLRNEEFRLAIPQEDSYGRTHPLSGERIAVLNELYPKDPAWNTPTDPKLEERFERVKAKLIGYVSQPARTLTLYPPTDRTAPAHYARAYAYHKSAYPAKAKAEMEALLKAAPDDPYYLELDGQILLESGKPAEALPPLRRAVAATNSQPLIASTLGHALIATEDPQHLDEAIRVLRAAVARDRENPFAWYQLGTAYTMKGDTARAALASAENFSMTGRAGLAARDAAIAMHGLSEGSVDWLRAQDISMVAKAEAAKREKERQKNER